MLTPTSLVATANPAVFLVPEDYEAGTLTVLKDGVVQQPGTVYTAAGDGDRTVTFAVAPVGWIAGTWVGVAGLGTGTYLTSALLQARVGGAAIYLQLTDDDGDGNPDPGVESALLAQVDAIVNSFASRGGYAIPLEGEDIETFLPYLLDIANYRARTRGTRVASKDDKKLYDDAMKVMERIATGDFRLPSFLAPDPILVTEFVATDPGSGCEFDADPTLDGF